MKRIAKILIILTCFCLLIVEPVLATAPITDFNGTPTSGIIPLTVNFTDLSTNDPTSWYWDFGDGNTSTSQNPSHEYTSVGNFTVCLNSTNGDGSDWENKTGYITVTSPPLVANFTAEPLSGTIPLTVNFTDSSTNGPTSWYWNFGDGNTSTSQNPSHEYVFAGDFTVSLQATNSGGSDTETKTDYITVLDTKWVQVADTYGVGDDTSRMISRLVTYDDGTGEAIFGQTYDSSYLLRYNQTSDGWVKVSDCIGEEDWSGMIIFNDGTGDAIYSGGYWDGILAKYNQTSNGWVKVLDPYGEWDDWGLMDFAIYDDGTGEALFTVTEGMGRLLKYDGTGDWELMADTYPDQDYLVSMSVYDDGTGEAIFATSQQCDGYLLKWNSTTGGWVKVADTYIVGGDKLDELCDTVVFNDGTGEAIFTCDSNDGYLLKWNSTSGGWVKAADPLDSEGVKTLALYDDGSGETIFGGTVGNAYLYKYNPLTQSWENVAINLNNQKVIFTLVKYYDGDRVALYGGTYTYRRDETSGGRLYKYSHPITGSLPSAEFSASSTSIPLHSSVSFTDESTENPEYWYWDFGDGNTSSLQNPSHTYVSAGDYTVSLLSANTAGHDTEIKTEYISVIPPPETDFSGTPTLGVWPFTVTFTDLSTGENITGWSWNFGDGSNSTLQNPTHQYTSEGTYTVSLTATNIGGSTTETKSGYISSNNPSPPETDFSGTPTTGNHPLTVTFTDLSTGLFINNWHWNFGDGSNSTLQNPTHQYTSEGSFTVSLTTTNLGGSDTETKTDYITVYTESDEIWGFEEEDFFHTESGLITFNATGLSDHTATLNGQSPGTDYDVYFVLGQSHNHYSYMTDWQTTEGTFNETLVGLPLFPGATYYYRAASESGAFGEEKTFVVEEMDDDVFAESTYGKYAEEFFETDGDFLEMIMIVWEPYEDMWTVVLFYGILLSMTFISIAWRQQSVIVTATLYILIGWPLASMFPPEFYQIGAIMCCIAIGGFIYWVFTKSR